MGSSWRWLICYMFFANFLIGFFAFGQLGSVLIVWGLMTALGALLVSYWVATDGDLISELDERLKRPEKIAADPE